MLWIKAFHIIAMVAWFSGLFYLPRLFVYHADCHDEISQTRFKIMEQKLYYYITTPAAILTIALGLWLLSDGLESYLHLRWMQIKLICVLFLMGYHVYLGQCLSHFKHDKNLHSARFYRWLNEVPTVFLIVIVLLVVIRKV